MALKVDKMFPGAEKHQISLKEAKLHIKRHKKNPMYSRHHGGSFDRAAIEKILAQPGCKRLRIYHGRDEKGKPNFVLVGVDAAGKDMTTSKCAIMEKQFPCPPYCDATSTLLR